ncbi:MAG: hypothetical protein JO165_14055 [Candidatus Eremiobacteraeota bacterium]|nr:hypothetical protein [Candidatus Eremiobacteraeota bacterium]
MRIAFTCNGPGETAGWLRPLLRELYARQADIDASVFFVPDDYATGREPEMIARRFPQLRVVPVKEYVKVALGGRKTNLPDRFDAVQYLGGDLMHASRIAKRFDARPTTYKFSRKKYAGFFRRAYAVDAANEDQLRAWGTPSGQIKRVGNLAIDGALLESSDEPEAQSPRDGILFMPGSRAHEVDNLVPFFFTVARRIRREDPSIPIALGISPFTPLEQVRRAVERGAYIPSFFTESGTLGKSDGGAFLMSADGAATFPIVRNALSAARTARLAVTIPGTKVIELAALGVPVVACTPLNQPELITINGPLTYLNRIPLVGTPLKRAAVLAVSRRFRFHTQPNIDAGRSIVCELRGTLTPGRVARVVLERFADAAWLGETGRELRELYAEHAGAASRMASDLLESFL